MTDMFRSWPTTMHTLTMLMIYDPTTASAAEETRPASAALV
jgi:hypothetical protein